MRIGLDFGTTHTTAAFYAGDHLNFIPLDSQNHDTSLLRSMIYITKKHEHLLGFEAVERYLGDNTGRSVKHERKYVGQVTNAFASLGQDPIVMTRDVYVEEDVAAPGRLLQSIKTGLRDPDYEGTHIYDQFFSIQDLIALLLSHVRKKAETYLDAEVRQVVLGRPVKFANDSADDEQAEQRLREAAELAGFQDITFEQEPIAAARFYLSTIQEPQTVLVFDFGGGTLDLTIVQADREDASTVLATQGVLLGGDDLDSAIMRGRLMRNFGEGGMYEQPRRLVPRHIFGKLEQWQTIPELSKEENMQIIRYGQGGDKPAEFKALACLATKNYGFLLFQKIEQAKRTLSATSPACLEMQADIINIAETITRREFEGYIARDLKLAKRGLDAVLEQAALTAADIDVVVTTGGSSLIPAFQRLLQERFPGTNLVQSDTFGSVVSGLAARASHQS